MDQRILLLACALAVIAIPQTGSAITGRVVDDNGGAVASAQVTFADAADSARSYSAMTDARGVFQIAIGVVTDVGAFSSALPSTSLLLPNYPNPFNPSTIIPYQLRASSHVRLVIYNVLGQAVRLLEDRFQEAGNFNAVWDGTDDAGSGVAAGLYLVRMQSADGASVRKMILLDGARGAIEHSAVVRRKAVQTTPTPSALYTVEIRVDQLLVFRQLGVDLDRERNLEFAIAPPAALLLEGDVVIREPEQLDDLVARAGGRPFGIVGNLRIIRSGLVNLHQLTGLTSVGGNLDFIFNDRLQSMEGISNLATVGGGLRIIGNAKITSVDQLQQLRFVGAGINISSNPAIESLRGLESALKTMKGDLFVEIVDGVDTGLLSNIPADFAGSISARPTSGEVDLSFLSHVTSIGGSFAIVDNFVLTSVANMRNLRRVGGNLNFTKNNALTDLKGLESLEALGGRLSVNEDRALTSLAGLENLRMVGEGIVILRTDKLENLDGLAALEEVGGSVIIAFNRQLTNIEGLARLERVEGEFSISTNDLLQSLRGPDRLLETFTGDIVLRFSPALTDLGALGARTDLQGDLEIGGSAAPTTLEMFNNLRSIGKDLNITGTGALQDLSGLEQLESVGGHVHLVQNRVLKTLDGLSSLESVAGTLDITSNRQLVGLDGLDKLSRVGDTLAVRDNVDLKTLQALGSLEHAGDGIIVVGNNDLTDLRGLERLTTISGSLRINDNKSLVSLAGLSNLRSIDGDLIVGNLVVFTASGSVIVTGGNRLLTTLTGLEELRTISGHLDIIGNDVLASIAGLANLQGLGGNLRIAANPLLLTSLADALVEQLTAAGFEGEVLVAELGEG
jgi:hypothetical protein